MLCDCGQHYGVEVCRLRSGRSTSCGCMRRDKGRAQLRTHGLSDHPLCGTWEQMLARCEDPAHRNYRLYGARGIRVCDRWHDFSVFAADLERWLGPRPARTTLDRICNDHDYRLDNVQWSSQSEQMRNTRRTRLTARIVAECRDRHYGGGETQLALAAEYGVHPSTMSAAIRGKTWRDN